MNTRISLTSDNSETGEKSVSDDRIKKYLLNNDLAEDSYVCGKGYENDLINSNARSVLHNVFKYITAFIAVFFIFDHLISVFIAFVLKDFIPGISIDYVTGKFYLSGFESYITIMIFDILKYGTTLIFLNKGMHLAKNQRYLKRINVKSKDFFGTTGLVLTSSALIGLFMTVTKSSNAVNFLNVKFIDSFNSGSLPVFEKLIIIGIFILMQSVFIELTFHSNMFYFLRQFGDVFAILLTSLICGMFSQSLTGFPIAFLSCAVLGFTILKTNSVYLSVIQRFLMSVVTVFIAIINVENFDGKIFFAGAIILILSVVIGIIFLIAGGYFNKKVYKFENKNILAFHEIIEVYIESIQGVIVGSVFIIAFILGCVSNLWN